LTQSTTLTGKTSNKKQKARGTWTWPSDHKINPNRELQQDEPKCNTDHTHRNKWCV